MTRVLVAIVALFGLGCGPGGPGGVPVPERLQGEWTLAATKSALCPSGGTFEYSIATETPPTVEGMPADTEARGPFVCGSDRGEVVLKVIRRTSFITLDPNSGDTARIWNGVVDGENFGIMYATGQCPSGPVAEKIVVKR